MENYFYDLPTASKRRNRHIFPSDGTSLNIVNLPELFAKARLRVPSSTYIYPGLALFSLLFTFLLNLTVSSRRIGFYPYELVCYCGFG